MSDNTIDCNDHKTEPKLNISFDDISLIDNNVCNDCDHNTDADVTIVCEPLADDKCEAVHTKDDTKSNDDSISLDDSTQLETPTEDDSAEDTDSDFIEMLRKKNGVLYDSKIFEAKYENKIIELQTERNELQTEIEDLKRKLNEENTRLNSNIDKLNKRYESTRKDLESMVMKYATSERDVIALKKTKEDIEKRLRDAIKDKESHMVRIKGLSNEKQQLMSALDRKVIDMSSVQRDYEELKNELKDRDKKWKEAQSKLRDESNAHNETKKKLESAQQRINELSNETLQLRSECHKLLNTTDENIEFTSNSTLSEQLQHDIQNYKTKIKTIMDENQSLTIKIQSLERERLDHEQCVCNLKQTVSELQNEITDYKCNLRDFEKLKMCLENEKELVLAANKEVERLKVANSELRSEMESCRHKEGELLEFTERLTAKSVQLQSEHNTLEQKASLLKDEVERLKQKCDEQVKENYNLNQTVNQMNESHQEKVAILAKKLAEKTKLSDELKLKVEEFENEIRVNKRRQTTSIKELNRELISMRKRLEHFEGQNTLQSDSVSIGSRTSSSTSLDTYGGNSNSQQVSQQKNTANISQNYNIETNSNNTLSTLPMPELDKQLLIERILRLQKSMAKKNEKIDFLEEHNHQLIEEMKKKSKLIQYYILREETGALSTSRMDDNKEKDKRQLARRGATVMSSLYNTQPIDSTMTLELSLEINRKLQAVLEDTILKNITLKESINTLGDEIARLTTKQIK